MDDLFSFNLVDLRDLVEGTACSEYDGCKNSSGQCCRGCGCGDSYGECGGWKGTVKTTVK